METETLQRSPASAKSDKTETVLRGPAVFVRPAAMAADARSIMEAEDRICRCSGGTGPLTSHSPTAVPAIKNRAMPAVSFASPISFLFFAKIVIIF